MEVDEESKTQPQKNGSHKEKKPVKNGTPTDKSETKPRKNKGRVAEPKLANKRNEKQHRKARMEKKYKKKMNLKKK